MIGEMVGTYSSDSEKKGSGETLGLQDEIGEIQAAIADFEIGKKLNVAIITGPFGGKTTLINEIEKLNLNRVTKCTFSEIVRDKKEISFTEDTKRIVLLDNCHFLYIRKPGGFDIFYEFLNVISSQNRAFITTWNTYSWKYLNEAFEIWKYFPVQIYIPAFEKEELKFLVLKRYGKGEIKFKNGNESEEEPLIYVARYPLELAALGKKIDIPFLKINIPSLKKRLLNEKEEEVTAEHRVFEKIYLESKGNPGIALRIWELGLDYPHIELKNIGQFSYDIELEHEEAFVLSLILSYESLKKSDIAEMIGSKLRADEIVFQLLNRELIFETKENTFLIRPEALQSVIAYLEKIRMVW